MRGDWYLAVAKGSVSLELGVRAIRILTKPAQEYNRFSRGVGLPVTKAFCSTEPGTAAHPDFFAWPHANSAGVRAAQVFEIHRMAFSRACIPGYTSFRRMLSTLLEEVILAARDHEDAASAHPTCIEILRRIPAQIALLLP